MRYFVAPEFSKKITALASHQHNELALISSALKSIGRYEKKTVINDLRHLGDDLYKMVLGNCTLYLTFGSDKDGEYALFLDLTIESSTPLTGKLFVAKDPVRNSSVNPTYNHSINPIYNHSINPIYNHSINPIFNQSINPIFNHSINPLFNHSINPIFNHSINPIFNHSINPIFNHSISPRFNRGFGGPYVYKLDLTQEGFVVTANIITDIYFGMALEFCGIGVLHDSGIRVLFDKDNAWTGFLVPTETKEVCLRFSTSSEWTGFVV